MEESSQIELYSCPAVRKRPLQPAVSPVADPFEDSQTTEEEAMEAEVIRMFTAWYTIGDTTYYYTFPVAGGVMAIYTNR